MLVPNVFDCFVSLFFTIITDQAEGIALSTYIFAMPKVETMTCWCKWATEATNIYEPFT